MYDQATAPVRARIGRYEEMVLPRGEFDLSAAMPPRKLYRVSEVAQHFELTRQTVHNYATIGLITESARTPGGQRLFDESVFPRLLAIRHLKRLYCLHEVRRMLDETDRDGIMSAHDLEALVAQAAAAAADSSDDPSTPDAQPREDTDV
jgi:DNA-binding transcriptional MerR regulator